MPFAAVVGSPVAHSLSPAMHQAAYALLGLPWAYTRIECASHLQAVARSLPATCRGLSVTMPLKEQALALASSADPVAAEVGAANTLVRADDGWAAHNTDVHGIHAALDRAGITDVASVLVLGSGATARSVVHALASRGAEVVTFATRGGARADTVAFTRSLGLMTRERPLTGIDWDYHTLVVDTLPPGAADDLPLPDGALPPLFEVVYAGWPTPLAGRFLAVGAPVASGLDMLAFQGAEQVKLMSGIDRRGWDDVAEHMRAAIGTG